MNSRNRLPSSRDSESSPSSKPEQMRSGSGQLRFAVDTGGTFTDLIVADERRVFMYKASTQPADPVAGVLEVMGAAARARRPARRLSRPRRNPRPRHDARHQRDRDGLDGADRVPHHGGPSRHAGLPRGRAAGRLQLHGPLSGALRPEGADLRDPRAHPERRLGARAARRGGGGRSSRRGSRRSASRRSRSACSGRSSIPRTRSPSARLIEQHLPGVPFTLSHRSTRRSASIGAPCRPHRRVAEADDERLSGRPRGAPARGGLRGPRAGHHLAGRRDGRRRRRRGAGPPRSIPARAWRRSGRAYAPGGAAPTR